MGLYTTLPDEIEEVDVIIAGGGTAGCVVAARLAGADPNLSILVVEGGQNNQVPTVEYPVLFLAHLAPTATTSITLKGNKSALLADREPLVPTGGILGGGSSINMLMYSRAKRSDFDSWNAPGWSQDEILPYQNRLETYHGPGPRDVHGFDGPIHVSGGTFRSLRSESEFIAAIAEIGWPEIEDLQTPEANNGVMRAVRYISPDGKRQDAASCYLHPRLTDGKHLNLHVLVEHQVVRILLNNKRAVGIECRPNPLFQPDTTASRTIRAKRMVVASCGACGTPSLLERSGIGSPEVLQRAGVPLAVDVPGVGHEYEDHQLALCAYKSSLTAEETVDELARGRLDPGNLIVTQDKILGWNAMDITCKLRPSEADIAALGPDFQAAWDRDFKDKPDRPMAMMALINGFPGDPTGIPEGRYLGLSFFIVYPYSRGHLHISGPTLADRLDFETGYLSDPQSLDLKMLMWAYKKQREIMRRMATYRGELTPTHPPFPLGSAAACIEVDAPLGNVRDIVYSAEDDIILEKWLRETVGTTWHSIGTCKMAPREDFGVVDSRLGVYGVDGLKIADLSIPPKNVAANTNNTAFVIGEKAADLFIEDLGLGRDEA